MNKRLRLCIVAAVLVLIATALWLWANRTTPFFMRATGLGKVVVEMTYDDTGTGITFATILDQSPEPQLMHRLSRGGYLVTLGRNGDKQGFAIGLGYVGSYRRRLDLDVSPAADPESWHVRLIGDGVETLFERDVASRDASEDHPLLIHF